MDQVLVRRILGTAGVVLVIAVGYLAMETRYSPGAATYEVTAVLGDAGSGLRQGSDVKLRGARIGEVAGLRYEDGIATAVLRLDDDPPLPPPDRLELAVTAKTLLGEKQVELSIPEGAYDGEPPSLEAGDTLRASREPTELSEALAALEPFITAIDARDLADIVDTLGAQAGEGERIARNIRLGQQLAAFGDRTADDTLDNLRALADVADALAPRADDFNRLNDRIPGATEVLRTQQGEITENLDTVSRFAVGFAQLLEEDEAVIADLLETSDVVGAVFERNADDIAGVIDGLYLYAEKLGRGGLLLTDRTEWAAFRILLDMSAIDLEAFLCAESQDELPFCADDGSSSSAQGEGTELGQLEFQVPGDGAGGRG